MSHDESIAYGVVLAVLSFFILFFSILVMCVIWKEKDKEEMHSENSYQDNPSIKLSTSPYMLVDIHAATDGFDEQRIVRTCQLGIVYEGVLGRQAVAVKRIHPRLVLRNAGLRFSSALKWLSQANHPNVVRVLGFSEGPGERIVVMEYSGMMSLEFCLHQNHDGISLLTWGQRFRVAAGAARGLEYLHEIMAPSVVHGCVKPSNILIEGNFNAKICDYGLTFLAPNEKERVVGYVDEEYWIESKGASKESDVYGLGVVLLELLSGRKSEGGLIVKWGLPLIKEMKMNELWDPRLVVPCDMEPLVRLAKVACSCVGNSRKSRPSIGQVVTILNNLEGFPFFT